MKDRDNHIKSQKLICDKYKTDWTEVDTDFMIALADNVLTSLTPINGLRHPPDNSNSGWYIWSGQEFSEAADFFKPYCIKHLTDLKPQIIKYLGLSPGHRFLIDDEGYEDVWEDKKLLDV